MDVIDLSTWTIVAVDDEPDSLEVLTEVLSMHEASVHAASSGHQALETLKTVCPDLVITDLSMPGMDGYQLLYKIRHMEGREAVPVIALTAHAMAGDRERILAAGFTGYVSKPLHIMSFARDVLDTMAVPTSSETAPVEAASPVPHPQDDGTHPPESLPTTVPERTSEQLPGSGLLPPNPETPSPLKPVSVPLKEPEQK